MKIRLNLVPPGRKEEIEKASRLRSVLRWEFEILTILIFAVISIASMDAIVKMNLAAAVSELERIDKNSRQYKTIDDYDNDIKEMGNKISSIVGVQNSQPYWSKFLIRLNEKVIAGITINKVTTENYNLIIGGVSNTRDTLISFKENIEKNSCFSEVDLPLSSLAAKDNIKFQIKLKTKKECLK